MRRHSITIALVFALVLPFLSLNAQADQLAQDKIDPALLQLMSARPNALLPVIVEMSSPEGAATNASRANEALDLLRANGQAVGGLAIIDAAAGFANATEIQAMSLVPTVAYIHYDATIYARAAGNRRPGRRLDEIPPPPTVPPAPTLTPAPSASPTASMPTLPTLPPTPTPTA